MEASQRTCAIGDLGFTIDRVDAFCIIGRDANEVSDSCLKIRATTCSQPGDVSFVGNKVVVGAAERAEGTKSAQEPEIWR